MKLTRKYLFRKYEGTLFYSDASSQADKTYAFYLLLRPVLGWAKKSLLDLGLLAAEAESELYIMCVSLFNGFDKYKSSLVPYLEKQIPWYVRIMLDRVRKYMCPLEEAAGLIDTGGEKELDEEFYWTIPNVLFEDRYVGKSFTRSEKYLIYMILAADESQLTAQGLAKSCGIDRRIMKDRLSDLQEIFNMENTND